MFHPDPAPTEARQHRVFDPKEAIEPRVERALEVARADRDDRRTHAARRRPQARAAANLDVEIASSCRGRRALSGAMVASAGVPALSKAGCARSTSAYAWRSCPGAIRRAREAAQPLLDAELPPREIATAPPLAARLPGGVRPRAQRVRRGDRNARSSEPKITGVAGVAFREYLVRWIADGRKGSVDLVVYFFLRAADIARSTGSLGLLATNTIAQGNARDVGLSHLLKDEWAIFRAVKSRPWPGGESLEVSQIWMQRGWKSTAVLNDVPALAITSQLGVARSDSGEPHKLIVNSRFQFPRLDRPRRRGIPRV